jgi:hypothetical protein
VPRSFKHHKACRLPESIAARFRPGFCLLRTAFPVFRGDRSCPPVVCAITKYRDLADTSTEHNCPDQRKREAIQRFRCERPSSHRVLHGDESQFSFQWGAELCTFGKRTGRAGGARRARSAGGRRRRTGSIVAEGNRGQGALPAHVRLALRIRWPFRNMRLVEIDTLPFNTVTI